MDGDAIHHWVQTRKDLSVASVPENPRDRVFQRGYVTALTHLLEHISETDARVDMLPDGDCRRVRDAHCVECTKDWSAPTIGRCPSCGSDKVQIVGAPRVADYQRTV